MQKVHDYQELARKKELNSKTASACTQAQNQLSKFIPAFQKGHWSGGYPTARDAKKSKYTVYSEPKGEWVAGNIADFLEGGSQRQLVEQIDQGHMPAYTAPEATAEEADGGEGAAEVTSPAPSGVPASQPAGEFVSPEMGAGAVDLALQQLDTICEEQSTPPPASEPAGDAPGTQQATHEPAGSDEVERELLSALESQGSPVAAAPADHASKKRKLLPPSKMH